MMIFIIKLNGLYYFIHKKQVQGAVPKLSRQREFLVTQKVL